jgi:hypothetical protein
MTIARPPEFSHDLISSNSLVLNGSLGPPNIARFDSDNLSLETSSLLLF